MIIGEIGIILAIALTQQPADTVAVIPNPDKPAIIMEQGEAEALFTKLCTGDADTVLVFDKGRTLFTVKRSEVERILAHPEAVIGTFVSAGKIPRQKISRSKVRVIATNALKSDDQMLRALAAALNPMPDWPQYVMNNEPSVCNRNPKPVVPIPIEKQSGSAFVKKGQ